MENKKEKKGIFSRLTGGAKPKKSPCCGGFVLEEIPEKKSRILRKTRTAPAADNSRLLCRRRSDHIRDLLKIPKTRARPPGGRRGRCPGGDEFTRPADPDGRAFFRCARTPGIGINEKARQTAATDGRLGILFKTAASSPSTENLLRSRATHP